MCDIYRADSQCVSPPCTMSWTMEPANFYDNNKQQQGGSVLQGLCKPGRCDVPGDEVGTTTMAELSTAPPTAMYDDESAIDFSQYIESMTAVPNLELCNDELFLDLFNTVKQEKAEFYNMTNSVTTSNNHHNNNSSSHHAIQQQQQPQQQQQQLSTTHTTPYALGCHRDYERKLHPDGFDKGVFSAPIKQESDWSDSDVSSSLPSQIETCAQTSPLGDPDASDWATREGGGYSASLNRPDGHGQAHKRSLGDWVRAAQAMHMHTPRKQADAQSKTPEDSGKKNRKLTSGGFAERLTRLQGRQRSSFSLWRHLSIAEDSAATAVQPGVLVLEVLDVREECSMQLVHCQQRRPPGWETTTTTTTSPPAAAAAATPTASRLLVLFDGKTSAQLRPAPGDIIHVYPPWQRLDVEDESTTVILNTHFSQKVYSDTKTTNPQAQPRPWPPPLARCVPYSLSNTFGLHGADAVQRKDATTEQVANGEGVVVGGPGGDMDWAPGHSLLEVIEGLLGQPGSVGPEVRVVVQRVYSCYVPERPTTTAARPRTTTAARPRAPPPPAAPPPRRGRSRLCALVQDGRGVFSVVQLQPLAPDRGELRQYTQRWQGRACALRNVKVVQRVTRERYGRAFHLIDSVWPPTIPFQVHMQTSLVL
ncbi:unnamed protein product [Boreogadus saida]